MSVTAQQFKAIATSRPLKLALIAYHLVGASLAWTITTKGPVASLLMFYFGLGFLGCVYIGVRHDRNKTLMVHSIAAIVLSVIVCSVVTLYALDVRL